MTFDLNHRPQNGAGRVAGPQNRVKSDLRLAGQALLSPATRTEATPIELVELSIKLFKPDAKLVFILARQIAPHERSLKLAEAFLTVVGLLSAGVPQQWVRRG